MAFPYLPIYVCMYAYMYVCMYIVSIYYGKIIVSFIVLGWEKGEND